MTLTPGGQPSPRTAAYPRGLEPASTVTLETAHGPQRIAVARPTFAHGVESDLADRFGNKGVVSYRGRSMFAELALLTMCVEDEWEARWVETFGYADARPALFTDWVASNWRKAQISVPISDAHVSAVLDRVARQRGAARGVVTYSGCSDVVAWKGDRLLFIESKLQGKDRVQPTQKAWLDAALDVGLAVDSFLIAEWSYAV